MAITRLGVGGSSKAYGTFDAKAAQTGGPIQPGMKGGMQDMTGGMR